MGKWAKNSPYTLAGTSCMLETPPEATQLKAENTLIEVSSPKEVSNGIILKIIHDFRHVLCCMEIFPIIRTVK